MRLNRQERYVNKTTYLLVTIFLGIFGINRFSVGKVWTGILWLLTAGLFGIGWVVDIVQGAVLQKDVDGGIWI
jgi:TM2 domain-containing membrane protein YozV